jgi:hypothetical protein
MVKPAAPLVTQSDMTRAATGGDQMLFITGNENIGRNDPYRIPTAGSGKNIMTTALVLDLCPSASSV